MVVDQVALIVHHFCYAYLRDLDAARQARTRVAVENCVAPDAVAASFEQGVFFGMQTETGREGGASFGGAVAARA